MEITTFELLVKRIAPPPASPTVARRVIQGYFLTISNLEDKDYTFNLDFHISKPNPPDPDRTLTDNAEVFYDIAGANTALPLVEVLPSPITPIFTTRFVLPAKQTASLQLLPRLSKPGLLTDANPDLEVRGFVRLRLPALRRGRFPFFPIAQSDRPIKVLLNPEIRGTFLPNNFPTGGGDFDQINYPLALASGKGLNEVEPERGGLIQVSPEVIGSLVNNLPLLERPQIDFSQLSDEARTEALVEVLAQVEPTPDNLQNVSDLLSKLNIPIRMESVN
jgi:hypothetical protein